MKDKRKVRMRKFLVPAVLLVLLVLLFPPVSEADWSTRGDTTTVLESYDDPVGGEAALPIYQYLRLDMRDGTGDGSKGFRLYGRLAGDLNDEVDAESRLYYAYYQQKDLWEGTDIRFGRQWVNTVAGSPILDGIRIDKDWEDLLKLTVFGGGYVTVEDGGGGESVLGFSIKEDMWSGADLSASYLQKRDGGDLDKEILGVAGSKKVTKRGSVYGELQYDMISRISSYYLAGIRLPGEKWTVKSEYFGYTPVFDSTSIYSVFAADEYKELSVSADYRLDRSWTVFGSYSREMYESFSDSNVVEAGCELRKKGGYGGYVAAIFRSGDEDLRGIKVDYRMPAPYDIRMDIGAEYNVYNRIDDDDDDDTSSKRYWLEGVKDLSADLTLRAKVERLESVVYDYYNRGRVSLRYRF